MKIKLSKKQWEETGRKAGWKSIDPSERLDSDIEGGFLTPDEEEIALLGEEDPEFTTINGVEIPSVEVNAYVKGYEEGYKQKLDKDFVPMNPYRLDTDQGIKLFDIFKEGEKDALSDKPPKEGYKVDLEFIRSLPKTRKAKSIKTIKILKIAQELKAVKTLDKLNDRELARALRDAIIAEEGAIKQYEVIVDSTDNEKIKKVVQDLADEEKIHVGELHKLISMIDKDEKPLIDKGEKEAEEKLGKSREKIVKISAIKTAQGDKMEEVNKVAQETGHTIKENRNTLEFTDKNGNKFYVVSRSPEALDNAIRIIKDNAAQTENSNLTCDLVESAKIIEGEWQRDNKFGEKSFLRISKVIVNGTEIGRIQTRKGKRVETITCCKNSCVVGRDIAWLIRTALGCGLLQHSRAKLVSN